MGQRVLCRDNNGVSQSRMMGSSRSTTILLTILSLFFYYKTCFININILNKYIYITHLNDQSRLKFFIIIYKELKCETYHIPTQHTLKQCPKKNVKYRLCSSKN